MSDIDIISNKVTTFRTTDSTVPYYFRERKVGKTVSDIHKLTQEKTPENWQQYHEYTVNFFIKSTNRERKCEFHFRRRFIQLQGHS